MTDEPGSVTAEAALPALVLDDGASDRRLGESVRLLRQRMGLSIQELGRRTGLSIGMISQLERGLATPSVRTLRLLSLALQVPISFFFEERPEGPAPRYIVRRGQRRLLRLTPSGVLKESLAPDAPGQMEMYELTLSAGGSSGADFVKHQGEKAGYVLSGTLRLWLDHEAHLLEEGDSFRFPSTVPHMFDNPTDTPTRIVWITMPSAGA
ncbi:helix-turn-helix domain-containing protein [Pseudoroseomonas cervicalis]|uniref:helix-turn-helix domain-containing protein n=1 Tax=Teichococcus cervicalis TaxID=204525 RepID=UPI00278194A9|nr:XRE family transcriptional regulator [Pseudoroseomonas cervicalis]MDQ1080949.1 transcriptional regulator with XRE-family HTH domain [Pseudoroseomonas cervicalis]